MCYAIILAGGSGNRFKSDKPKQFVELEGKPILIHTLEKFQKNEFIKKIIVVSKNGYESDIESLCKEFSITKLERVISGGNTRQESVFNSLSYLNNKIASEEIVLIHDGVRPFVSDRMIKDIIYESKINGAATFAVNAKDSMMTSKDGNIVDDYRKRWEEYQIQTPQAFRFIDIYNSHNNARSIGINDATDDSSLIKINGGKVKIVFGNERNIKITNKIDYLLAELIIKDSIE